MRNERKEGRKFSQKSKDIRNSFFQKGRNEEMNLGKKGKEEKKEGRKKGILTLFNSVSFSPG